MKIASIFPVFILLLFQPFFASGADYNAKVTAAERKLDASKCYVSGIESCESLKVLIDACRPLPLKLLVLDACELYSNAAYVDFLIREINKMIRDNIASLDSIQIVGAMFQLDSLLDHFLLSRAIKEDARQARIQELLEIRKNAFNLIQDNYEYLWIAMELISQSPSLRTANLHNNEAYPQLNRLTPSVFLNQVKSLRFIPESDRMEALYVYSSAIALLSSRLEDPELGEDEKQFIISAFLDHAFIMSRTRMAWCLGSMMRAGRIDQLKAVLINFPSQALLQSLLYVPGEIGQNEVRACIGNSNRKLAESYFGKFKPENMDADESKRIASNPSIITKILNEVFPPNCSLITIFKSEKQLKRLVSIMGFLSVIYGDEMEDSNDIFKISAPFISDISYFLPTHELYNVLKCPFTDPQEIVLYSVAVMATRSFRNVSLFQRFTCNTNRKHVEEFNIPIPTFQNLCVCFSTFNFSDCSLSLSLKKMNIVGLMNQARLTPQMKSIFVDALIAVHISTQMSIPRELLQIQTDFSCSQLIRKLKRSNTPVLSISQLESGIIQMFGKLKSTLSTVLLAFSPSVHDGPEPTELFIGFFKKYFLKSDPSLEYIFSQIFVITHELIPEAYLKDLIGAMEKFFKGRFLECQSPLLLSTKRKEMCYPLYPLDKTIRFILADKSEFRVRQGCPEDVIVKGIQYAELQGDFSMDGVCKYYMRPIFDCVIDGVPKMFEYLPEKLVTAVYSPTITFETPFFEIAFRLRFLALKVLNLPLISSDTRSLFIQKLRSTDERRSETAEMQYNAKFKPSFVNIGKDLDTLNIDELLKLQRYCGLTGNIPLFGVPKPKPISISFPFDDPKPNVEQPTKWCQSIPLPEIKINESPLPKKELTKVIKPKPSLPLYSQPPVVSPLTSPPPLVLARRNASPTVSTTSNSFFNFSSPMHKKKEIKYENDCNFSYEFIIGNCDVESNGLVHPKANASPKFIECFIYRLLNKHPFPFKVTLAFFNFITIGAKKGILENEWNHSVSFPDDIDRMSLFFAKPRGDLKLIFEKHGKEDSILVEGILCLLDPLDLGRLETLIRLSAAANIKAKKDSLEQNRSLIRVRLDPTRNFSYVHLGWLHIPQFLDAEALLDDLVGLLIEDRNIENEEKEEKWKPKPKKEKHIKKTKKPTEERARPKKKITIEAIVEETIISHKSGEQKAYFGLEKKKLDIKKVKPIHFSGNMQELVFKFDVFKYNVTPQNFSSVFFQLREWLHNGEIDYIAFDCEMTGLYTQSTETAFANKTLTINAESNVENLIEGVMNQKMFQLGLAIKRKDGLMCLLSIFTDTQLQQYDFTVGSLDVLFIKPLRKAHPQVNDLSPLIENQVKRIRGMSISTSSLKSLITLIFESKIPLVVFSGYSDLMHLLKSADMKFAMNHERLSQELLAMNNLFWDVKRIAEAIPGMERARLDALTLMTKTVAIPEDNPLHDAAFDALLTAICYDYCINQLGPQKYNELFKLYKK